MCTKVPMVSSTTVFAPLQQMAVCAESLQSCPALCDPMDCSPLGSSVHGILQARILEWVACPSSRGSSWLKDRTLVSCIAGGDNSLSELSQHYFGKWYSFAFLLGYCFLTTQTSFEKCWERFKPQWEKLPCWKGLSFEIGLYGSNIF